MSVIRTVPCQKAGFSEYEIESQSALLWIKAVNYSQSSTPTITVNFRGQLQLSLITAEGLPE